MKTSSMLGYGEAESLMTDTVDIYHCLAVWHSRVCRLRFGPTSLPLNRAGLFTKAFFAPLLLWNNSRQVQGEKQEQQKERYKCFNSRVWLCRVSHLLLAESCGCKISRLGLHSPRSCRQTAAGARLRRPSLWHDRRYRKAELHKPEQFKV